jgi:hypothetical protein
MRSQAQTVESADSLAKCCARFLVGLFIEIITFRCAGREVWDQTFVECGINSPKPESQKVTRLHTIDAKRTTQANAGEKTFNVWIFSQKRKRLAGSFCTLPIIAARNL